MNFSGVTTNLSTVNISNITNFVLENPGAGRINFTESINLSGGADLDSFVEISHNLISLNSTALEALNKSANITIYGLSNEFDPVILRDGSVCPASVCSLLSYNGENVTFNVSHFTSYSAANNSNLSIFDQTDAEGGGETKFINQNITFYANYTNTTSGEPINSTGDFCEISFNVSGGWSPPAQMAFNTTSLLYENVSSFSSTGKFNWSVSCYSNEFENLTSNDSVTISVDTEFPRWSANITSVSSPAEFSSFRNYQFNVTWTDNNAVHTVLIEHNFSGVLKNYTVTSSDRGVYYYDYENISAGSYVWREYANDSSGNMNVTDQFEFVVNPLGLFIYQYLEVDNFTNVNITYNLTVVVLNNATETQININVTPDSRFGKSYIIPSLSPGETNETELVNKTGRGTADEFLPVNASVLGGNYSGTSNNIVSMNPIDPPSKLAGKAGVLYVSLVKPDTDTANNVIQNSTFVVNATVVCGGGSCGNVTATVRYNDSSPFPDTPVSTTKGGSPFYVAETPAFANKSCPANPLEDGEFCNITWTINATGSVDTTWKIGVLFNSSSSGVKSNHTDNSTVSIVPCVVDITTQFSSISFGRLNPDTNENNATKNDIDFYNITINEGSCDTDLYIKGTHLRNSTLNSEIGVGNITFSNSTNSFASSFNLSLSYQVLNLSVPALTNVTSYYWINVPPVYAGAYTGTITYSGVRSGYPPPV
jgi:hypothetical protein